MITWRMAAAWVLALVLATVLTWQIVGLADSQVGETPAAVAPPASPNSTVPTPPSSTAPPVTSTTTKVTSSSSSSTSTTSETPTTSEPTTAEWSVRTINSPGGTVVVRYRPEQVELQAATPAAGFSVEVDDDGPHRVRVEFESEDDDFRVEARWEGGQLSVEIDD